MHGALEGSLLRVVELGSICRPVPGGGHLWDISWERPPGEQGLGGTTGEREGEGL